MPTASEDPMLILTYETDTESSTTTRFSFAISLSCCFGSFGDHLPMKDLSLSYREKSNPLTLLPRRSICKSTGNQQSHQPLKSRAVQETAQAADRASQVTNRWDLWRILPLNCKGHGAWLLLTSLQGTWKFKMQIRWTTSKKLSRPNRSFLLSQWNQHCHPMSRSSTMRFWMTADL